jgi:hypothetical protein
MENLTNIKLLILILLLFSACNYNEIKEKCVIENVTYEKKNIQGYYKVFPLAKGNSQIEQFDITLQAFSKVLQLKQFSKMDDYMFPEMKTYVLKITDSLCSNPPFKLKLNKHEQLFVDRDNDSTIRLSIGYGDPALGIPIYVFVLKGMRYLLFDIPKLK